MRSKSIILILFVILSSHGICQEYRYGTSDSTKDIPWINEMYKENPDPAVVIPLYQAFYKENAFVKNQHTQYYKRWLRSMSRALDKRPALDKRYLDRSKANIGFSSTTWTSLGPYDWDHEAAGLSYAPGSAHVYTVERAESNHDIMLAGTATAGLWKSSDGGLNWLPLTYHLIQGSITAVEIDHSDELTMYSELQSSIHKSSDGGLNWAPTGDAAFQAIAMDVRDIRMHPTNASIIWACTNQGLYQSTNAGTNWTQKITGDFQEIEFHPEQHDTIYTVKVNGAKTEFYRSLNAGSSFTHITNGWPDPDVGATEEQKRVELSVSLDQPDYVFALATGKANGGSGLYGVYVSTDNGASWTFECCGPQPAGPPSLTNPNLMGWSDVGTDDGGQYYYDLGLAVAPDNADSILVAGVNLWVSGDGGTSFVCPAKWSHSNKPNYVHADIHDVHYFDNGEIWIAGDGGIFHSIDNGANYTRRNVGILGTDFWGFGMGHWYGDVMLGGAYHNGTLLKEENTYNNGWLCTDGGDGTLGFVNPSLDRQVYSWFNIKALQSDRTIAPITRGFSYKPNASYIIGLSSDLIVHPTFYNSWISGSGTELVRTEDNGYNYTILHDFGDDVAAMDQSWSDPDVIYACTWPGWWDTKRIYRSDDGGINWTEITPPSGMLNGNLWVPYDIAVSPTDPMKVWIVRTSMYGGTDLDGYMVYESSNGGATWQNISGTGLEGEAPTCLMHQKGTESDLYVGTRRGVYHTDHNGTNWTLYNSGLPVSTFSTRILPYYRKGKIRNGTNRSVWEADMINPSDPLANLSVDKTEANCLQDTFYFVDYSIVSENGVSWNWSFPGGTPSTSTLRTPKVVYNQPGYYDVTLIVSDINGADTITISNLVRVDNLCGVDEIPGLSMFCTANPDHAITEDLGITQTETFTISAWIKPEGIQDDYAAIFMNDGSAAGLNFREGNNTLGYHWPDGQWWWDSNLIPPSGEWSHVALVADQNTITIYLNGVSSIHNIDILPVDIGQSRIGSYKGWASRNYRGEIDEVSIWNRALTQDEIREIRHLTRYPQLDPTIYAYYQFNVNGNNVLDKIGGRHAILNGSASKITSGAPVGGGVSQRLTSSSATPLDFPISGLLIGFNSAGTHPDGELVVSHLKVPPNEIPQSPSLDKGYWIVNNYGNNQTFTQPDSLRFYNTGTITSEIALDTFKLFRRSLSNEHNDTWSVIGKTFTAYPGFEGAITASNLNGMTSFSQFFLSRQDVKSGTPVISIIDPSAESTPAGGDHVELYLQGSHQGLILPSLDEVDLANLSPPELGALVYNPDKKTISFYNGSWHDVETSGLLIDTTSQSQAPVSSVNIDKNEAVDLSGILDLSEANGTVNLSNFSEAQILAVSEPSPGMLACVDDVPAFYDGANWKKLIYNSNMVVSSGIPGTPKKGMATSGMKHIEAALDINSTDKVLRIPINDVTKIHDPAPGTLVFDPANDSLLLFDGSNWNILNH